MREEYCEACETLKDDAYSFATNGVTTAISNRLKDDNGFSSANSVDTDCEALNIGNDCLIGGQEDTLENYDVCDIKVWLKESWANLHTMLKAIIAAICGLWTKIHCILSGLKTLLTQLSNTSSFASITQYAWGSGGDDSGEGTESMFGEAIDAYKDYTPTTEANPQSPTKTSTQSGSYVVWTITGQGTPITYPSDGVAIVGGCVYEKNFNGNNSLGVLFHTDSEWDALSSNGKRELMNSRGLHYTDYINSSDTTMRSREARAVTAAIQVKAGDILQVRVWPLSQNTTSVGISGIHQIWSVFIPNFTSALNIDPTLFDGCGE